MGIIPAFAGNTNRKRSGDHSNKDHPRIRGEHSLVYDYISREEGSSPHSRGTPTASAPAITPTRIIPAFAGNTLCQSKRGICHRDHPRIRGEHSATIILLYPLSGSSPHSRGTLDTSYVSHGKTGIIPAFAGNTSLQEHPH